MERTPLLMPAIFGAPRKSFSEFRKKCNFFENYPGLSELGNSFSTRSPTEDCGHSPRFDAHFVRKLDDALPNNRTEAYRRWVNRLFSANSNSCTRSPANQPMDANPEEIQKNSVSIVAHHPVRMVDRCVHRLGSRWFAGQHINGQFTPE